MNRTVFLTTLSILAASLTACNPDPPAERSPAPSVDDQPRPAADATADSASNEPRPGADGNAGELTPPPPPNLVMITLDTTRADRLGCQGYIGAATPTLDALATAGIRFDDAVTVAPITLPAHATIMTALDPPRHGVRQNGEYQLDEKHETLAELLRTNGYETAAFVSAFVPAAEAVTGESSMRAENDAYKIPFIHAGRVLATIVPAVVL